eukprot:1155738-Pelagomonas_calceolata.AAC.2
MGTIHASGRPTYGVKQGCPLSPLLFAFYLNDISGVLKVLKELVQEYPVSMFHTFYMPMNCASQLNLQIFCRPCFTG